MTLKPKSKRGGVRAGAGAKPTGLPDKKPVCIRMAIDLVEWLATIEKKQRTATIESAIRAWRDKGGMTLRVVADVITADPVPYYPLSEARNEHSLRDAAEAAEN